MSVSTAIILAAGTGSRLHPYNSGLPKGLLYVHGDTLVGRSLGLLSRFGMERIILVTGYQADRYRSMAAAWSNVELVHSPEYTTTGSMASLDVALELVEDDVLVLESDLFYEPRALDLLTSINAEDVVLVSGPTAAGDEVWVQAPHGRVQAMSKERSGLSSIVGEFVGICRFSRALCRRMRRAFQQFRAAHGHARMSYETDALVQVAAEHPVNVHLEPTLLWGEIDDINHLRRVRDQIAPRVARLEGRSARPMRRREILLNPGPSTTTTTVKNALVIPDVCPRERSYTDKLRDVLVRLARLVGDPEDCTAIPVVGSGTAAMEAVVGSVVQDGRSLVIIDNGDYGARLAAIAERLGVAHETVQCGWGKPVAIDALEARLASSHARASHLAVVHHETSSGLLNPLPAIAALCQKYQLLLIVDAMSSFAAIPLDLRSDGVDFLIASANKCIQGMAGLAFVIARNEAIEHARGARPRSYYLDLVAQVDSLRATGQTRFTSPPQIVSALEQALTELERETIAGRRKRYDASYHALVAGLEGLGFELLLAPDEQSRILVTVREPEASWYDFDTMHDHLLARGFTIYPGKPTSGRTFRLSVLGAISELDIRDFLAALGEFVRERRDAHAPRRID
jgi:2-aminoethylphosphonate-pyruvate transaminase